MTAALLASLAVIFALCALASLVRIAQGGAP
jgi:hypothetical protein